MEAEGASAKAGPIAEQRAEARLPMSLRVRICEHCGPTTDAPEYHDAVTTDLTPRGASLFSTVAFGRGELVQVQFVRPSRKNATVGQRLVVVARVVYERRLGRNGPRPVVAGLDPKRFVSELGVEFLCVDQRMAEWLQELTGANGHSSP